jgi:hypothetical protein
VYGSRLGSTYCPIANPEYRVEFINDSGSG